jgi:hypothetical protein
MRPTIGRPRRSDGMPKPKPDNIVRHEIVLGRSERELLDTATTAYTANRIMSPLSQLLSSNAGLLLVSGVLLAYLERYLPPEWKDMDDNQLSDWFDTSNIALGTAGFGIGGIIGAIFGGPIGAAIGGGIGAVGGTAAAEVGEAAYADPQGGMLGIYGGPFGQLVAAARILDITIDRLQGE